MTCRKCRGKGTVWVDLRRFRFGSGFAAFMSAGCLTMSDDTGGNFHEIVCPDCDGATPPVVVCPDCGVELGDDLHRCRPEPDPADDPFTDLGEVVG